MSVRVTCMTHTAHQSWRRRLAVLLGLSLASVTPMALTQTASAASQYDPPVTIRAAKTKTLRAFRTEWLPEFPVSGSTTAPVVVAITLPKSTPGTTFTVGGTGDAVLNYGYTSFSNVTKVAFTSSLRDAVRALRSLSLNAGEAGKVTVAVSISLDESDVVYEPISSNYYRYVRSAGRSWTDALAAATTQTFRGVPGFLAAIETAEENDFIAANIPKAANIWIGGTDRDNEGEFKWAAGPSAGTTFWKARCASNVAGSADSCTGANNIVAGGQANGVYKDGVIDNPSVNTFSSWDSATKEPNNWGGANQSQGGENFVATNWNGTSGLWNDLPNNTRTISGYLVEFPAEAGKPFVGVLRQSATFTVTKERSAYAPTNVKVTPTGNPGEYTVTWGEPTAFKASFFSSFKKKGSAARARANFRSYLVSIGEYWFDSVCILNRTAPRTCVIDGVQNGVEPIARVIARYGRHPSIDPKAKKYKDAQTTFGAYGKQSAASVPEHVKFSRHSPSTVSDQSTLTVEATGLAPNSPWTLKNAANGRTIASGTTSASGAIAATRKTLPTITRRSEAYELWQIRTEFSYVNAAGLATTQPYSFLFRAVRSEAWSSTTPRTFEEIVYFLKVTTKAGFSILRSSRWGDVAEYVAPLTVEDWPAVAN